MKVKDHSVKIADLHPYSRDAAEIACQIIEDWTGFPNVITSGNDGRHSQGSYHYRNRATDHRTWTDATSGHQIYMETKKNIAKEIKETLNEKYKGVAYFDVIAEHTHIHVELDQIFEQKLEA